MTRLLCILFASLLTLTACPMNAKPNDVLPRNMALKAFDPHRPGFECKHEAKAVPPIDPEAEAWFQEGMRLTSMDLWPNQRDYPKAVALWSKAAERKHWKAMMNLAGVLIEGDGTAPYQVQPDTERAVQIVEGAMRLGIPAAFDTMGTYHQRAMGVKGDISRAYAFWDLAADKGSPRAQVFLGDALNASYDNPKEGFWGNRKVGLQMLECSYAQGHGKGAYELGSYLESEKNYPRALVVLHEGVKMGSSECARSLSVIFSGPDEATKGSTDIAREERYKVLSDALYLNPDLRFPNLDKVLPLPPARLPMWDGKKESLINAAKAVVPVPPAPPKPAPNPASQRTGRAHVPEGWALPERPQFEVPAQYETTAAPADGYWIARLMRHTHERHIAWDEAQVPMRYAKGELFDRSRPGLRDEDGRIQFHYLGELVAAQPDQSHEHPLVVRGIARYSDVPEPPRRCEGGAPCPQTGVWSGSVPEDHPMAAVFNQWHRQAYLTEGQDFPDPKAQHLGIESKEITWQWLGQTNEVRGGDVVFIRVDEPMANAPAEPGADAEQNGPAST
jgi:hypothetical protein